MMSRRHAPEPIGSSPIRAVLFDVDGTLYHQRRLRAFMATELAAAPLTLRSVARTARLARVLRTYRRAQEQLRETQNEEHSIASLQISYTAKQTGVAESEIASAVTEWMINRPLRYLRVCRRAGLLVLLETLQRRHIRLGVLSDYPCESKLAALDVASFFSPVLCAADPDINAFKPSPRGFWRACERWNVAPEEVLYVGDRPDIDARGAHAAGMRCVIVGRNRAKTSDCTVFAPRLADVAWLVSAD